MRVIATDFIHKYIINWHTLDMTFFGIQNLNLGTEKLISYEISAEDRSRAVPYSNLNIGPVPISSVKDNE